MKHTVLVKVHASCRLGRKTNTHHLPDTQDRIWLDFPLHTFAKLVGLFRTRLNQIIIWFINFMNSKSEYLKIKTQILVHGQWTVSFFRSRTLDLGQHFQFFLPFGTWKSFFIILNRNKKHKFYILFFVRFIYILVRLLG